MLDPARPAAAPVTVWDAPVRLFHWTLAGLVVFSFVTAKVGGNWTEWHMRSGYSILALLLFRIAWGLVGSQTARFASFVRGPRAAVDFVRASRAQGHSAPAGHNPLGGWMVVFMILALFLQAITGLFVDDEIFTQGPLAAMVSNGVVATMTTIHRSNEWVIVGAVVAHLAAIATYHWGLGTNLVGPMIHGRMHLPMPQPLQAPVWMAALLFAASCGAVYWLVVVFPRAPG